MKWVLSRHHGPKQTTGCLYVFDGEYSFFNCKTLELPWKDNQKNLSCYPEGEYWVKKYQRPSGKWAFLVENVPGRSGILFHAGTYIATSKPDSEGCTLIGFRYDDMNDDGEIDILDSQKALGALLKLMPDEKFKLQVI
jgi:hypothetical protein